MSALYPKYRVIFLISALVLGVPWTILHALSGEYITAVVLPVAVAVLCALMSNVSAGRRYDRLILKTYAEACDGEAFRREHAKLDPYKCKSAAQQAVVLTNGAVAAFEGGDDRGAFLLAEEALARIEGQKGIPTAVTAAVTLNCGAYAALYGRLDRAREMCERLSALRQSLPEGGHSLTLLRTIEEYERRLSFDIRFRSGDCGDEVRAFFADGAEKAAQRSTRVSYGYELGCIALSVGDRAEAERAFRAVIRDGNTLRAVRDARARLSEMGPVEALSEASRSNTNKEKQE